jgi:hypothetical protein
MCVHGYVITVPPSLPRRNVANAEVVLMGVSVLIAWTSWLKYVRFMPGVDIYILTLQNAPLVRHERLTNSAARRRRCATLTAPAVSREACSGYDLLYARTAARRTAR